LRSVALTALTGLLAPGLARAQYFTFTGTGDLLAGFRQPGVGNYELVVNLGNITNFLAQSDGSTVSITNLSPTQLSAAFSSYDNLQWSAFATFTGAPNSTWSGFPLDTIWFTVPRLDVSTQSAPPLRHSAASQDLVRSAINSIGKGARTISQQLGATDDNNNEWLVREPVPSDYSLSRFIGNPQNSLVGDFGGYLSSTAENQTPAPFNSAARSDLYQAVPNGYADPKSGTASGDAYYVGFVTLNPDGTLTFTRATAGTPPPPAPRIVSITRSGTTSTISFTTASGGFTYTLHYTDAAGLATPVANWPSSPTTVAGDGSTKSLSDTSTDSARFYTLTVQ
jgi:hypothetical protein